METRNSKLKSPNSPDGAYRIPREQASLVLLAEPLKPGGMSSYACSLLRALPEAGFAPRLATSEGPPTGQFGKAEAAAIEIFPGLQGGFWRPFVFPRLVNWARERSPALIHGLSAFAAPAAQRLAQALDLPYVLSVHHYQTSGLRLDARCRGVLACSESIRENLVNDARVPKELVRVVPIGIQIPVLEESAGLAAPDPERLPLVATISKLTARKNVATFLRAARQVLDVRGGQCQFLVVGEGPEEPMLRKLTRKLELEKHLTFANASTSHRQILGDVEVYVQTSLAEGFGAAVLEAMAFGRPVVATSVGGLITLVRDGQTGYLVPVNDPAAAAGKILCLLEDEGLRRRLGAAGRASVSEHFTVSRMMEGTIALYANVLGLQA